MGKKHKSVDYIAPFYVMEILEKANDIESQIESGSVFPFPYVIHLEVGEPDFPSHENVRNSAIESIIAGNEKYTHSLGSFNLRKEISKDY